MDGKEQK